MLVYLKSLKFALPPNANAKMCVTPDVNPQREQVEYRWQKFCVGHIYFILFVSISFALGSQREPSIQWNMGFKVPATCFFLSFLKIDMRHWGTLIEGPGMYTQDPRK